jgi:hypothetical protein
MEKRANTKVIKGDVRVALASDFNEDACRILKNDARVQERSKASRPITQG